VAGSHVSGFNSKVDAAEEKNTVNEMKRFKTVYPDGREKKDDEFETKRFKRAPRQKWRRSGNETRS